jgi:hypothetical protein
VRTRPRRSRWRPPAGSRFKAHRAVRTRRCRLGLGRPEDALDHLTAIVDTSPDLAHPLVALFSAPDLVEAAVRSGRAEVAEPVLENYAGWAQRVPAPSPPVAAARMRALLADGEASRFVVAMSMVRNDLDRAIRDITRAVSSTCRTSRIACVC